MDEKAKRQEDQMRQYEAAEEVLAQFRTIVSITQAALLEEADPIVRVADVLIRSGISLDDRHIATNLSPCAQLLARTTQKALTWIRPPEAGKPAEAVVSMSPPSSLRPVKIPLPSALADIENSWWAGTLPDYLPSHLAEAGGMVLDAEEYAESAAYWDRPYPVSDSNRWD